jgi:hypothetical protein
MFRIAHLADLAFGSVGSDVVDATVSDLEAQRPDLVVVSGNVTRRATAEQFEAARAFLDRLPAPRIVVPGPRDAGGFAILGRLFRPLARFRSMIASDLEPSFENDEVAVLGIDTARPRLGVRITSQQAGAIRSRLGAPGRVSVLVTHEPLVPRPARGTTASFRADPKDLRVVGACVDLVLAGYQTVGTTQDTRVAYRILNRQAIAAQAALHMSGPKGADTTPYYNAVTIDGDQITIAVRLLKRGQFEEQGPKSYRHDGDRWEKHVEMPPDFQWSDGSGSSSG